jgi:Conserved TM helix
MWDQATQSLRESMVRAVTKIATLLPGLLAFVLAVVLFTGIAWLLAFLVKRLLAAIKFDERMGKGSSSLSDWAPTSTPSSLMVRTIFWGCFVVGVLVGLTAFDASSTSLLAAYLIGYLPRVVGALVLLFVGTIMARFLSRSVLIGAVNLNLQYARLLSTGVKWLVLVLTGAMVLDHLSVGGTIVELAFGILFGGIVLALALAVGLGSRDLVTRSLEREATRATEPETTERLHHF